MPYASLAENSAFVQTQNPAESENFIDIGDWGLYNRDCSSLQILYIRALSRALCLSGVDRLCDWPIKRFNQVLMFGFSQLFLFLRG